MDISFLIVTRHRPEELKITLRKLESIIDLELHEVLVFIDDCPETEKIIQEYNWVQWHTSQINLGASPARHHLYEKAVGTIFIGLDDDAHPLNNAFIEGIESRFRESELTAIIAFQEIRGIFESDAMALENSKHGDSFLVNEFIGCGFAIKKDIYNQTNGFPLWMDIYGEESALSLEVMELGYDIVYDYSTIVNHRIDVEKRKLQKRNYFRFEKQIVNSIKFYIVYHKKPSYLIFRALWHNFKKYALSDFKYFTCFLKAIGILLVSLRQTISYRKPVQEKTITLYRSLKAPFYH